MLPFTVFSGLYPWRPLYATVDRHGGLERIPDVTPTDQHFPDRSILLRVSMKSDGEDPFDVHFRGRWAVGLHMLEPGGPRLCGGC